MTSSVNDLSTAHLLMRDLLPLKDQKWIDGSRIADVVERLEITDIEARIYFLRELHGIARRLPIKIFQDNESRLRFISAIQDALDHAVNEEDEE